jgi:hypothetical protein
MCFSANASFFTSALLLPCGAAAIRAARIHGLRRTLPLAIAPVLFGLQQACEGFVWIGLQNQQRNPLTATLPLAEGAALAFLFFAYALWPVWIPWAAVCLLPEAGMAKVLPLLGLVPGLVLWVPLLGQPHSALPEQVGASLVYALNPSIAQLLPPFIGPGLYAAWIVLPLCCVPSGRVRLFALTLLLAFALSAWTNSQALTSIWCFASALLSAQILWIVREETGVLPPKDRLALPS